jgi:predicted GH43/DUF377 family glycosyl hydrolase
MVSDIGNFVQKAIQNGGNIYPLLIPTDKMVGPSLMNPSIINLDGKLLVNLRNVNYTLYHSENGVNEHVWGPLCYLHTEQHQVLATHNIICELDNNFNIIHSSVVDTSTLDVKPLWEFVGLEDGRLIKWNNKLFLSGVRRDTTTNGQGRIELSEIDIKDNPKEINRQRLPAPEPNNSYCEKNWMPIIDRPYQYVKWTNPTEVVEYDPTSQSTKTIIMSEYKNFNTSDLRGGSQVIPYENHYLAILHEVHLFTSEAGRKDAIYRHRFVLWDQNLNPLRVSPRFDFMDGGIEFACGMTEFEGKILITFGFQDNAAYLLSLNKSIINEMVGL